MKLEMTITRRRTSKIVNVEGQTYRLVISDDIRVNTLTGRSLGKVGESAYLIPYQTRRNQE